ncbi:uncharacterized protein LOC108038639 [Drosophila rhopaloa]|uniref:Uncharacterized protein LOC108038639 n=1 Tax=Drosophila rhopaloa TaxID=1041015 RepID=A0A6P4DZ39_DRORH|nr:uncharacterized protein LOC108038639 [Drosophila rhopaloa]
MVFFLKHVLSGDRIYLMPGLNMLGRHSNCTGILKYDYMSRFHAIIMVQDGRLFIREVEALNGVFVNYSQDRVGVELREIYEGDDLSFGIKLEVPEGILQIPLTFGIFTVKKVSPPGQIQG